MIPKSAEGRYRGILYFKLNFVEKGAPNWPKAEKGGNYIFNLILLQNEPQIGRRSIKGEIMFSI
jgi:hypothetical protein